MVRLQMTRQQPSNISLKKSRGYDQISHTLSNIHGLYEYNCVTVISDVISVYSLNWGKLSVSGPFSYKQPGYEANTGC